jgi:major membrane immunogen (membrane-anchored lipoprotein)
MKGDGSMSKNSNLGNKKKGIIGLVIMLVFSVAIIFGSDAINSKVTAVSSAKTNLKDGTYKAEEKDFDKSGYKGFVTMEVKGGKITIVTWDASDKDGNNKSKLSKDGKYVMTEKGAKWHEQAQALATNVIQNQSVDKITINQSGKTDAVASVSISVGGFINLVKDCMQQATK